MSHSLPEYNMAAATTSSVELTERCSLHLSDQTHLCQGGICNLEYTPEARNILGYCVSGRKPHKTSWQP